MLKLYTLKNCPNCDELKKIFKQKNVSYEELNVDEDFIARARMVEHDLEEMPVLEVSGQFKSGPINELAKFVV